MADQKPARASEKPASPTMRELVTVLFRQWKIFVGVSGSVFVLAVIYAFAGATYRAQVRVLVRRGRSDPPMAAQENAPPDFSRVAVTEEELNSEVELLKDDDVLRRVVEANDLAAHDWLRWLRPHEERAARAERAVKKLARRIDVEPIKKTNLIAVSYDASDPRLAAHVLQSLAGIYLEKHMEVHRPGGQLHFFDQQTQESRRQLEEANKKLVDFTKRRSVVMAAQQRDLALQRVDQLESTYQETQVEMSETEHRVKELESQLAKLPQRTTTQVRTADNPELLRALKASLLDLELKKTLLLTKYQPNTRQVQEAEQQILQAQAAIAAERLTPVHDETTDQNPNYEWARAELQKAHVQLKGLEARGATTSAHLVAQRTLARQLGEDAILQDDLTSTEKAARENYLLYVKKREEARMGDALDEGGIVNVAIAEQPVVPALPVWPAGVVVLGGFVAALASGTAAAFTADHLDPALRTPEDVLACLEMPVLASLPEGTGRRISARRR
jgi:succinoglycan biosynthesis transport protein ExoP